MKKNIFFFSFLIALCAGILPARAIEVFVTNSVFYAPDIGTYVETDLYITSPSVQFVQQQSGKYKATAEVILVYKQGEKIAAVDKYLLHSIETADTNSFATSLIDKKRFALAPGSYTLEASFRDVNRENNSVKKTEPFSVDFDNTKVVLSDITMIDSFYASKEANLYVRNDYYMIPQVLNYFPEGMNKLTYYAEVYNIDKLNDQVAVVASIKKFKENEVVGNLITHKKMDPAPVQVVLAEFDISKVVTGNYYLTVEVRSRKGEQLAMKQLFFQRSNELEITEEDLSKVFIENTFVESLTDESANYHLKTILPISKLDESKRIRALIKEGALLDKQRYFLLFWTNRSPADPFGAWQEYAKEIKMVNDNYGTPIFYGFETERGRVRLQYGAPTDILEAVREPGALPYEIWQYNRIDNGQTNVKFVFYNPDLVTNNYVLIHSTANGEPKNEHWQRLVYESFTGGNSPTEINPNMRPHYGSKATDWYKNE